MPGPGEVTPELAEVTPAAAASSADGVADSQGMGFEKWEASDLDLDVLGKHAGPALLQLGVQIKQRDMHSMYYDEDLAQAQCSHEGSAGAVTEVIPPRCAASLADAYNAPCHVACDELCIPVAGMRALDAFALGDRDKWTSLGLLAVNIPVFAVLFYLALRCIRHERR